MSLNGLFLKHKKLKLPLQIKYYFFLNKLKFYFAIYFFKKKYGKTLVKNVATPATSITDKSNQNELFASIFKFIKSNIF